MNKQEIEGSIKKVFPEQSGISPKGSWRCKNFLVLYDDKFPKEVILTAWGDVIEKMEDVINRRATFSFEVSSKDKDGNDKYYTSAKVWRVQ